MAREEELKTEASLVPDLQAENAGLRMALEEVCRCTILRCCRRWVVLCWYRLQIKLTLGGVLLLMRCGGCVGRPQPGNRF